MKDNYDVIGESVAFAIDKLRRGGVIGLPTETVYGLAADADNIKSIQKIFTLKQRPTTHPLIVHVANETIARQYISALPDYAKKLMDHFWPGPLTLILPKAHMASPLIAGGQESIGIRAPSHPLAQQLLSVFGRGVVAPSANRFGRLSPTTAQHVAAEFWGELDYILDGGRSKLGIESTIVDATSTQGYRLLRPGIVSPDKIAACIGPPIKRANICPKVSGSLASHYAPQKPLFVLEHDEIAAFANRLGNNLTVLCFSDTVHLIPLSCYQYHVMSQDALSYAHELYFRLRQAESTSTYIIVESPPSSDEWLAIWDRLRRASFDSQSLKALLLGPPK